MKQTADRAASRPDAEAKGLKYYSPDRPCEKGHPGPRYTKNGVCVECARAAAAERRAKLKGDPNLAAAEKEKTKKWLVGYRNKPEVRERINRRRRVENLTPEQLQAKREASRKTDLKRKVDPNKKEARNATRRERLKTPCPITGKTPNQLRYEQQLADEFQRAKAALRNVVIQSFKRQGFTKLSRTGEILGCDWLQARAQIERQFRPGMTWENHGSVWELDHIVPLAKATDLETLKRLCHISNLRPIWKPDNRLKGAQQTHLI